MADVTNVSLLSWNVAGWKTAVEHIKRFGGLGPFLLRHHSPVLCLQETKLISKTIVDEWSSLEAKVDGYESFWACNEGKGGQRQGLNGVATYARKGQVLRADGAPLGSPELDQEGRCLLTDHGSFVVFNCYAPYVGAGRARLPFKIRWLQALRLAMQRERTKGKFVIVAGDLNLKHRAADAHWAGRFLNRSALVSCSESDAIGPEACALARSMLEHWPTVCAALSDKEIRPLAAKGDQAGKAVERWGIFVPNGESRQIRLGPQFDSESIARTKFVVDGIRCEEDANVIIGSASQDAPHLVQRDGDLQVHELGECMRKIAGMEVHKDALKLIADAFGENPTEPSVHTWLTAVLGEDKMIDSFAALHGEAVERFTCWDQSKLHRQENIGSRVDYILVDEALFAKHAERGLELCSGASRSHQLTAEAALAAAALGGRMMPTGLAEGPGMMELHEDEFQAQFREKPYSGIVYTPQQLSDHVGVSVLLHGVLMERHALSSDPATRLSQPHLSVKRISDFFSRKPVESGSATGPKRMAVDSIATPSKKRCSRKKVGA